MLMEYYNEYTREFSQQNNNIITNNRLERRQIQ